MVHCVQNKQWANKVYDKYKKMEYAQKLKLMTQTVLTAAASTMDWWCWECKEIYLGVNEEARCVYKALRVASKSVLDCHISTAVSSRWRHKLAVNRVSASTMAETTDAVHAVNQLLSSTTTYFDIFE